MRPTLRTSAIWLLLIVLTTVSWLLGERSGRADTGLPALTADALLLLALLKVSLIGEHFMELRTSPWGLRLGFQLWVLVVCGGLVLMLRG